MSYAKAKDKYAEDKMEVSTFDHTMCSVSGCQNRWSVQVGGDKPRCSFHQWNLGGKKKDDFEFKNPPVQPYNELPETF